MKEGIKIHLPRDELPHADQAIEWWYFNGFLSGKKEYAFMNCLFKADKDKLKLSFIPFTNNTIYFSHSLLFNLTDKTIKKEILPFVITSSDSQKREKLFFNYVYPLKTSFVNYEIARIEDNLRIKNDDLDLMLSQKKKPIFEGKTGHIKFGSKSAYYYSYTNLQAKGYVGDDPVTGKVWHDKQWSKGGFVRNSWLWFSMQMKNNTEIVCFDFMGKKMATVSYPNGLQKDYPVKFTPIGSPWTSPRSKLKYQLDWELTIGEFKIRTRPMITDCEMNFGFINYWEGPLSVSVNGLHIAKGFMEYLAQPKELSLADTLTEKFDAITHYNKYFSEKSTKNQLSSSL